MLGEKGKKKAHITEVTCIGGPATRTWAAMGHIKLMHGKRSNTLEGPKEEEKEVEKKKWKRMTKWEWLSFNDNAVL